MAAEPQPGTLHSRQSNPCPLGIGPAPAGCQPRGVPRVPGPAFRACGRCSPATSRQPGHSPRARPAVHPLLVAHRLQRDAVRHVAARRAPCAPRGLRATPGQGEEAPAAGGPGPQRRGEVASAGPRAEPPARPDRRTRPHHGPRSALSPRARPQPGAAAVSPPRPAVPRAHPATRAHPTARPPTVPARAHARPAALTPPRAFSPARSEPCAHTPPRSPHLHAADTDTHSLPPPRLASPGGSHSGLPSLGPARAGDVQVSRFPHAVLHHPRPSLHLPSCNHTDLKLCLLHPNILRHCCGGQISRHSPAPP